MTRHSTAVALVGLTIFGCSLRSLDHLQGGEEAGSSGGGSSGSSGSSGDGSAGMSSGGSSGSGGVPAAGNCNEHAECSSGVCRDGFCAAPTCDDAVTNGSESDVDCGGNTCHRCNDGQSCSLPSDCISYSCGAGLCRQPSCSDTVVNGDETDIDCGGGCKGCVLGKHCSTTADCVSGTCIESSCTPTCPAGSTDPACTALRNDTAYVLKSAQLGNRCVDVFYRSPDNGAALVAYSCEASANQAFWAVAHESGWYMLRSSLSGKCMSVRGGSLEPGAVIDQWTCTGTDNQLWQARELSPGVYQLVAKHSGLSLGASGGTVATVGLGLVQQVDDGSAAVQWALQQTSGYVSLATATDWGRPLRHNNNEVVTEPCNGEECDWRTVPGLAAGECVSFESRNLPGHYLRRSEGLLWTHPSVPGSEFAEQATFCLKPAFTGGADYAALHAWNDSSVYVHTNGTRVGMSAVQTENGWAESASWIMLLR
jgi:hypothetical protein